jgi:hypothetical protein
MPCPLQLSLDLQLPTTRPLIPAEMVMVMLDRDEDQVLTMIESGALTWAWDIASADAERREIRVWRECMAAELSGLPQPDPDAEAQALATVLPPGDEIRSSQLRRRWTASQGHIQHLIDQHLLQGLNAPRRGPYGYVRISRSSAVNFLRTRRIF